MCEHERDVLIGLGLLCIVSGVLTGRARQALWRLGSSQLGAEQVRTKVAPSGLLGALAGRASVAELHARGGRLNAWRLSPTGRTARPARVREARFQWDEVTVLGLDGCSLRVTVRDAVLDGRALLERAEVRLVRHGSGDAEVRIPATALVQLLERRLPGTRDVQVALEGDGVRVQALGSSRSEHITASARLDIRGGSAVYLTDATIASNGKPAPAVISNALLDALNPVFRLEELPGLTGMFNLTSVHSVDGTLRVSLDVRATPPTIQSKE